MKAPRRIFACIAFLWAVLACSGNTYNPGDPATTEWGQTRLLECIFNPDCPLPRVSALAEGFTNSHSGLLLVDGSAYIWGDNASGQLGRNDTTNVGDGSGPSIISAGTADIGGTISMLAAGDLHTCALLSPGTVRCWGDGGSGRLGYNAATNVGDGTTSIIAAGDVQVGGTVTQIAAGTERTCALLNTGAVRCWGNGNNGGLGYNSTANVGDGTTSILAAGDVPIGETAVAVSLGNTYACATLSTGNVRCWGGGGSGRLGYGNTTDVGDGGTSIITAGDVPVGGTVTQIAAGASHTCALLSSGAVRCWGKGTDGRLGYNSTANVGDGGGLAITAAGDVPIGETATQISVGLKHSCALLSTGAVRCWGAGDRGRLGHDNTTSVGDGTGPTIIEAGDVPLGGTAVKIVTGRFQTCAIMSGNQSVRCWGGNKNGLLGYNSTTDVGDGTGPSIIAAGDVPFR